MWRVRGTASGWASRVPWGPRFCPKPPQASQACAPVGVSPRGSPHPSTCPRGSHHLHGSLPGLFLLPSPPTGPCPVRAPLWGQTLGPEPQPDALPLLGLHKLPDTLGRTGSPGPTPFPSCPATLPPAPSRDRPAHACGGDLCGLACPPLRPCGTEAWGFSKVSPTLLPLLPHSSPQRRPFVLQPHDSSHHNWVQTPRLQQDALARRFGDHSSLRRWWGVRTPPHPEPGPGPMVLAQPLSHKPSWPGSCEVLTSQTCVTPLPPPPPPPPHPPPPPQPAPGTAPGALPAEWLAPRAELRPCLSLPSPEPPGNPALTTQGFVMHFVEIRFLVGFALVSVPRHLGPRSPVA